MAIALWLLGRSRSRRAIPLLRRFAEHGSERVRIQAVKALRRIGAWNQLDSIAELDSSPRVRRIAASAGQFASADMQVASRRSTYDNRLSKFLDRSVEPIAEGADQPRSRMAFWSLHPFLAEGGPKSSAFIREILERIRAAVRGALR